MRRSSFLVLTATVGAAVAVAAGCAARATTVAAGAPPTSVELGRAELWAAYCGRCHNMRSRTEFSPTQWAVIINHMRTVADLPGEDYRRLLEFLGDRAPAPADSG